MSLMALTWSELVECHRFLKIRVIMQNHIKLDDISSDGVKPYRDYTVKVHCCVLELMSRQILEQITAP